MQCLTHSPQLYHCSHNGANALYDEETTLTSNHEDSEVPQQCAEHSLHS